MNTKITVPDIGDFENVEIIEVLVKTGDVINKNDPIVTLESDKSSVEVPTPYTGKISSLEVKIGDKVSKSAVLAILEGDKASTSSKKINKKEEVSEKKSEKILLITGIANSIPLLNYLTDQKINFFHLEFPDHYKYSKKDRDKIHKEFDKACILTTEKDYFKIKSLKLKCQSITSQRNFLISLGIQQRAEILSKNLPFLKKADIYYRLKRLIDKDKMGNLFKVMLITNKNINFKIGFEVD